MRAFKKAGLDAEVRSAKKHYLVYCGGELVYKFGQGTTTKSWQQTNLEALIRRLRDEKSSKG